MPTSLTKKFTLNELRAARTNGSKVPMLTCYDFSTARVMQEAGIPAILVGDSAANVILGHPTTLPIPLDFMIELTAGVRRGAPLCLVMADMPFGSYQASVSQGVKNVCRMVQLSSCDCVKVEVGPSHDTLVSRLADAGVAVVAHLGLRPQSVGLMGGYKFQGKTAHEADRIVTLACQMEKAGAAALLVEAVPPEVSSAIVKATGIPVIGCGAGPACHGHVFVTHDAIGLSTQRPRFAPQLGDAATMLKEMFQEYVRQVANNRYPGPEHLYEMPTKEKNNFSAHSGG